jgi:predicted phosphohydrolase
VRIAFTSDIHVDVTDRNRRLLVHLAEAVTRLSPDVFVIAGDVANDLKGLATVLSAFSDIGAMKLFVPGNHDLWVESKSAVRRGRDSWYKYLVEIPEACSSKGFHCLVGSPLAVGQVGFVGSVGWYDYSLRDHRLDGEIRMTDYERGEFVDLDGRTSIWSDACYSVWLRNAGASDWRLRRRTLSTVDVFARVLTQLEKDLQQVSAANALVCVLHTNPFVECIDRRDPPDPFDAYLGSGALGRLLVACASSRPTWCICGHLHGPLDDTVEGVRVLRRPVGYLDGPQEDLAAVAADAVGLIELEP